MRSVAIVTPDIELSGGARTMALFLHKALTGSGKFRPEIVSLAISARDESSVQVLSPASWWNGVKLRHGTTASLPFRHVGAFLSELEFQRYRPRKQLSEILSRFDVIQVVSGSPTWACVASDFSPLLWTASLTGPDRLSRIRNTPLPKRIGCLAMMKIVQRSEAHALKVARHVFALSQYTYKMLEPAVSKNQLELAPCGVDTGLFHPASTRTANYILSVGRFSDARKNVRMLLEAYNLVATERKVPELWLAGAEPDSKILNWLSGLKCARLVRFLGPITGRELQDLYRNALFFLLSSDEEGLAIVLLEAMASGLAVITTRCGGPETVVLEGGTGLMVPINDAVKMASAIQRLLSNPKERNQMGEAARQLALDRFSIQRAGQPFIERYEHFLSSRFA